MYTIMYLGEVGIVNNHIKKTMKIVPAIVSEEIIQNITKDMENKAANLIEDKSEEYIGERLQEEVAQQKSVESSVLKLGEFIYV